MRVLLCTEGEDLNEAAIRSVPTDVCTLIITQKHDYAPPISVLVKLKDSVAVAETSKYCDAIREHIGKYKAFVIVGFSPNNFESEFFRQVCTRLDKTIMHVKRGNASATPVSLRGNTL